jgi:alpha-tubulin suppressor-like RCC1 family protein
MNLGVCYSSPSKNAVFIAQDGILWAWGRNEQGSIGVGYVSALPVNTETILTPRKIPLSDEISRVFVGRKQSYAPTTGTLMAWGSNSYGALGLGDENPIFLLLEGVKGVGIGRSHGVALMQDSLVMVWGVRDDGQHGNGKMVDLYIPEKLHPEIIPEGKIVAGVVTGFWDSFLILGETAPSDDAAGV